MTYWMLSVNLAERDDDREFVFDERPQSRTDYGNRTIEYHGKQNGRSITVVVSLANVATVTVEKVNEEGNA